MNEQNYEYEKVVDDIYQIGINIILRFSVVLAKRNEDGYRRSYYQEYPYNSKKYKDQVNLITLKRQYDYFLSIENLRPLTKGGEKEFIMITVQDFLFFRDKIAEAASWLTNSDIYRYRNNDIIMVGSVNPIIIDFSIWNKSIELEPIVMKNDYGVNCSGIRMTIGNDRENFCDISVDRFMGLYYIINNFNMHMCAMNVLSFMGRPTSVSSSNFDSVYTPPSNSYRPNNGKPGRFVGSNNNSDLNNL